MLPHEIMKLPRFSLPALLFCIPVLVTSCGTGGWNASLPPASSTPVEELTGYFEGKGTIPGHLLKWEDDPSLPGKLLIVVDKKKQMMYVYRGTHRIAYAPISSGKSHGMTPDGYFRISSKDRAHQSYYGTFVSSDGSQRDGDIRKESPRAGERFEPAKMPYFMRVNGAVGIHEGYLPGHPSSHGCIRIPHLIAANLFEVAPVGTRVIVKYGSWNVHDLQKKPDSHFKTVHRPSPDKSGVTGVAGSGGNSSSPGLEVPLKSEQSAGKNEEASASSGASPVAESSLHSYSPAEAASPSPGHGLPPTE